MSVVMDETRIRNLNLESRDVKSSMDFRIPDIDRHLARRGRMHIETESPCAGGRGLSIACVLERTVIATSIQETLMVHLAVS
jgi:hypothetical protein